MVFLTEELRDQEVLEVKEHNVGDNKGSDYYKKLAIDVVVNVLSLMVLSYLVTLGWNEFIEPNFGLGLLTFEGELLNLSFAFVVLALIDRYILKSVSNRHLLKQVITLVVVAIIVTFIFTLM